MRFALEQEAMHACFHSFRQITLVIISRQDNDLHIRMRTAHPMGDIKPALTFHLDI